MLVATTAILGLAVAALCFFVFIRYPSNAIGTRPRPDLPGPKGVPLLGNLIEFWPRRKTMLAYMTVLEKQYGELFSFTLPGGGRNIVINRPEWLEHVKKNDGIVYGKGAPEMAIFKEFPGEYTPFGSEGSRWKTSRKLIKPIFSTKSFSTDVTRAMGEVVPQTNELLANASKLGVSIDFNNFCGRLSLAIFWKTALNLDAGLLSADPAELLKRNAMVEAASSVTRISSGRIYNPAWKLTEKFDGIEQDFQSCRSEIYNLVDNIIKQRQGSHEENSERDRDFLSTLLQEDAAQDPVIIRDLIVTLLYAGKDTTQNALTWSLYELARAPEWLDRMRQETIEIGGGPHVFPYENLNDYHIHLAVLYETLRLWPGVPKNAREAIQDDVIPGLPGEDPIRIDKGDHILWSDYDMMRNEKVWGPDAKVFNPGRHLDTDGHFAKPPMPKFHAFGAGARLCPGAQLGTYEFITVWTGILPSFDLVPVDMKDREPADSLTMAMDGPFWVRVTRRD